jgi:TolB-like protein/Flp pilus assembly protein TadD
LIVALAMGFPVAVVLAWVFELTPQGVQVDSAGKQRDGGGEVQKVHPVVYAVGAVSALAVGMLAYLLTSGEGRAPDDVSPQESIAVLPFVNMSDSRENEYFSDGLTEEILNVLARIGELRVASRTSAFYFKGKDVELTDIASRLSVRYVLEGSVRLSGATMRVTAQLIDGQSGFHLWSETYDRDSKDIFAVQSDIAQQVARNLKLVLSSASKSALARPPTDNYEAYDFYLRGRDYLRRPQTDDSLDNAIRMFDQAVELDPGFSLAQAGICETRLFQYRRTTAPALFEQAEKACHRALTRAGDAVEVLVALGTLHQVSGQLAEALDEFDKAIAMQPRFAAAHMGRADVLDLAGRAEEAEAAYKEAIEIDRGYWEGFMALGNFYFGNGRYAEAVEQYQEVIRRTPDNASAFSNIGAAYFLMGDFQSAAEIWLKSLEILPSMSSYANVGAMYYYLGRFEDAVRMFQKAIEIAPDRYVAWGGLGDAMIHMPGRRVEALQAYKKAAELVDQALSVNPGDAEAMSEGARYWAALGDHERAAALIEASSALDPRSYYLYYSKAQVLIARGDLALAEESLMRAVELGFQRDLLAVDASLEALKGRPRFEALAGTRSTGSD